MSSDPSAPSLGSTRDAVAREPDVGWLVRLRWLASSGQLVGLAIAWLAFDAPIPYATLGGLVLVTLATNVGLARGRSRIGRTVVVGVLTLDTVTFTAMLALTGGPENPFCLLYAVHVALAAVALGGAATWWLAGFSAWAYAWLFVNARGDAPGLWHSPIGSFSTFHTHLVGMWLAMAIVVAVIAYFADRISSALRERDRELEVARAEADRSARLASIATLAAGAAHELGSPLGTIAVAAREMERALASRPGDETLACDARLVRDEVDRCRAILDRMIASGEPSGVQNVPLDELLREVRSRLGEDRRRVDVEVDASAHGARIPRDVVEVLMPVLWNALEASEPTVPVALRIRASDERVEIEVEDRGAGIDAHVLARVGEPFFTTKPPGRGTGLGLHVARLVCQRLGGDLELRSTPGAGTLARVTARAARAAGGVAPGPARDEALLPLATRTAGSPPAGSRA